MAVVLVLPAALTNASALELLRKAALAEPTASPLSLRRLWRLLHRPVWALEMAAIVAGFLLQAAALSSGAGSLVQLILVLELPFTLILGRLVLGGALRSREWTAVAMMTVGLALVLDMLEPHGGDPNSTGLTVSITAAVLTAVVIVGLVVLGRRRGDSVKAALFGVAAGMTSGLLAVLVKAVLAAAAAGGVGQPAGSGRVGRGDLRREGPHRRLAGRGVRGGRTHRVGALLLSGSSLLQQGGSTTAHDVRPHRTTAERASPVRVRAGRDPAASSSGCPRPGGDGLNEDLPGFLTVDKPVRNRSL